MIIGLCSNSLFAQERIQMTLDKGVYNIPCEVNGLKLSFVFDTGASAVHISLIEAAFMLKNGYIKEDDFIGTGDYTMADGSIAENTLINLKTIKIGNRVINNVTACVSSNINASLLLGQSAIKRLGKYAIDGNFLILYNSNGSVQNDDIMNDYRYQANDAFNRASILLNNGDIKSAVVFFNKASDEYLKIEDWNGFYRSVEKSASYKDAEGMHKLSFCYYNGYGVPKDYKRSFILAKESAQLGYVPAQRNLGICYEEGIGTEKNIKQAIYWYTKSAEKGDSIAQNNLAICYYNGNGVKKDIKQAVYWIKKASENSNPIAMNNLGAMYEDGDGIEQNYEKALYWYAKAIKLGNEDAQYNYDRLTEELESVDEEVDDAYNNSIIQYYTAQVSAQVSLKEGPGNNYKSLLQIPKGSSVIVSSVDDTQQYRKVLYIDKNIFGYVNKNYLKNLQRLKEDSSGSLQVESRTYASTVNIKIENRTNKNTTITLGDQSYSFTPHQIRIISNVNPGKYTIMASAPGVMPYVVVDNVEAGYEYSWVFFIKTVRK